jgi:molybdopterin/thiamine biosynthesis adenylyltransferase
MMGFRQFTLIDCVDVEENDIARTPYRIAQQGGVPKTEAAKALVEDFAFDPRVEMHNITFRTDTDLDAFVQGTSLIVNTTDQPYVGYTNIKLSRYSLQHDIPVFAAGGFDAHLSSLGELLIPHVTPCADCYATFFHESLKDWKPIPHPVKEREGWFGGLGSLSTFSASTAALEILGYFMSEEDRMTIPGGRGEFLFHDYSLDTFVVERDKDCQSCGEKRK